MSNDEVKDIEVAVLRVHGDSSNSYEYSTNDIIISAITAWEKVSEEELKILKSAVSYRNGHTYHDNYRVIVIERIDVKSRFIENTVKDYLDAERKRKEKELADRAAREAEAEKRRLKKIAKTAEQERKLLETLKKKYDNGSQS